MQFVRVFREFSPSEEDRSRKTFLPVKKDEILAVSWKDSSFAWLWVSRVRDFEESQKEGFIPSSHCRPVQYTSLEAVLSSASSLIVTENVDDEEMFFFDPMNAEGHADGPVLSPDLATLCWPMSSEQFVETVWRRRIFCVHGSVDRIETSRLAEDFPNAYETLLESSESPVVFMKTLQGNIQHVVSTPGQAKAAFLAGHTIYFDPNKTIQREWLCPISKQLPGTNFAIGCGKRFAGVYGEIEVFLSAGLHETPFHFDFQESITIQLAGCKRWLLTPSHFRNPTHNASPFIFDRDLFFDQLKIHGSDLHVPPAEELMRKSRGVTLRAGSVLYVPAGTWHRVEAVVDALSSHSLSICLSFPCQRRADLVSAALLTSLLQVPELREPLGEAHDLAALETALEKTRSVLAKLKAAHILPPCARDEEPFITINLRDEEELPKEIDAKIALPACLSRSVVSRLVFLDSGDARISCSFAGVSLFSDGSGDTTCVTLLLSPELQQQTRRICNLDTISPSDGDAKLLKALFYSGFLVEHE